MKTEGGDILKLSSSTKATDPGGLTFGPAWLRQLSSGDTKVALPPSPGLAFQLAKHRYGREEMLAIYEAMESKPFFSSQAPASLEKEFEDLYRKELQRPVLLYPPSHEEQKFLSTCVNSQMVLNSYNKSQPVGGGGGGENRSTSGSSGLNGSGVSSGRSLRSNGEGGGTGENSNRDRNMSSSMSRGGGGGGGSSGMRGVRGGANGERGPGRGERSGGITGERGSISERSSGGSGGGGGGREGGGGGRGRGNFLFVSQDTYFI